MTTTLHTKHLDQLRVASQPRKRFDEAALQGLADSIRESGLQHPILVRREKDDLVVIDGERRLRACRLLGLKEASVLIVEDPVTIADALVRQLACNLQREDLGVIERAEAIRTLMQQGSMTADQVAKKLGQSPATVSRTLSVLKLPEPLRAQLSSGQISADAGYMLARVEEPEQQAALAAEVVGGKLTRDALTRKLKRVRREEARPERGPNRVTALLGGGRSITVAGKGLSLETIVEALEQLLSRAKKAKSQGLSLTTFVRTLRDQATT